MNIVITGGTGSFGRAFAKYLLDSSVAERICIYSRDEHKQAQMALDLRNNERLRFFIGDVRDRDRLRRAFDGVDVVVHAAALKRIEVGQYNACEMVKTNILGAMNVIEAAQDAQVGKVVALSTDKAYQPISPYGQSKALAESLFLNANQTRGKNGPRCSVVRYGNIWGSNGSVVPKWKSILATGAKTVPVTHPLCSRFYMTLDQAVGLVFDTIGTMEGGELRIPSLPAYRIGDLAEAMGAEMDITGLPAWEKRAESMRDGESSDDVRRMSVQELRQLL